MKYEWSKQEKDIYLPKVKPTLVTVPKMKYFTISGKGNPNNNKDFQDKIGVLYSLSYAVRMMPRKGFTPEGYFEYTVYPLEGIWDLTEEGRKSEALNKDELVYTIMIRQPNFVTNEVFNKALEIVNKKKPNILFKDVKFEEIEDGLCVQMLHVGAYDDEPKTFEIIKRFLDENGYKRKLMIHKEIYLSDFRRAEKDKLKTVLRVFINK